MRGASKTLDPDFPLNCGSSGRGGAALNRSDTYNQSQRWLRLLVSLGSGASLGPEGPSVEIGANFGVLLAQVLQMSQERQRLLWELGLLLALGLSLRWCFLCLRGGTGNYVCYFSG